MIENAVKTLNELLEADPGATNEFFLKETIVNISVCEHPTIQVRTQNLNPLYGVLRPLGLINGLFAEGNRIIIMKMNDSATEIIEFCIGTLVNGKVEVC